MGTFSLLSANGEPSMAKVFGSRQVHKYTSTGHLDRHFGEAGMTRSSILDGSRYLCVSPRAIAFDASGNAIVVGHLNILTVDTPAGDGFICARTERTRLLNRL